MEFLLVNFDEKRQLVINTVTQGWTNSVEPLPAESYDITLTGKRNFSPDSQRITLRYTAPTDPAEITFHLLPPSAVTPDMAGGAA